MFIYNINIYKYNKICKCKKYLTYFIKSFIIIFLLYRHCNSNSAKYKFVILDDDDCPECEEILEQLEEIDGEADLFGIDFVKINSADAAAEHGLHSLPALLYFRKKTPMIYDGDLTQGDRVLDWLTSQDVFEIKNEIEEVNRKMLEKLLEENEFVTVFFCKYISNILMNT